jgi:hypothetical protein
VKSGDEFVLGFRKVEWDAIGFGESTDEENDEADYLPLKDGPPRYDAEKRKPSCMFDHLAKLSVLIDRNGGDKGQRHWKLIPRSSRRSAKTAEEEAYLLLEAHPASATP